MKRIVRILVLVLVISLIPLAVFASSYKDVSKKKVGKDGNKAITYIEKHDGYSSSFAKKGGYFHPKWKITRGQFRDILVRLFGADMVPDRKDLKKKATIKWATSLMVDVAERIGMPITWDDDSSKKLTRVLASQYLKVFIDFDSAFKPRQ